MPVSSFHSLTLIEQGIPIIYGPILNPYLPLKRIIQRTIVCESIWKRIYLFKLPVSKFLSTGTGSGLAFSNECYGYSVPKDNNPKGSTIKLIHNICVGFNGDYPLKMHPIRIMIPQIKIVDTQNFKHFLTQVKTFLPHLIALTIEQKLSSKRIIPDACCDISVPPFKDNPTSAFFKH